MAADAAIVCTQGRNHVHSRCDCSLSLHVPTNFSLPPGLEGVQIIVWSGRIPAVTSYLDVTLNMLASSLSALRSNLLLHEPTGHHGDGCPTFRPQTSSQSTELVQSITQREVKTCVDNLLVEKKLGLPRAPDPAQHVKANQQQM